MINEETLFILGAGASKPYGMPLGTELREFILDRFIPTLGDLLRKKYSGSEFSVSKVIADFKAKEFIEVYKDSNDKSIDLFLSRNKKFIEVGKLAIAVAILEYEKKALDKFHYAKTDNDWYNHIFHLMTQELTELEQYAYIRNNNVHFLTFNYDRTLEFYLSKFYLNSFNCEEAHEVFSKFQKKIFHVYNSVAGFNLLKDGSEEHFDFGGLYFYDEVKKFSERILTISERTDGNVANMRIAELISNSTRIFILGFGFANENLAVLNLKNNLRGDKKVYCTAMEYTNKEIALIKNKISPHPTTATFDFKFENQMDCLQLIREYF